MYYYGFYWDGCQWVVDRVEIQGGRSVPVMPVAIFERESDAVRYTAGRNLLVAAGR